MTLDVKQRIITQREYHIKITSLIKKFNGDEISIGRNAEVKKKDDRF